MRFDWLAFAIGITVGALVALIVTEPAIDDARIAADLVLCIGVACVIVALWPKRPRWMR